MTSFELVEVSFWDVERKFGELPPLTDDVVITAERQLGVLLPEDLLRLLRRQNGGIVADLWDACPADPNSWARDHVPFETLFGIAQPAFRGPITLLDTPYLVREWDLPSPGLLDFPLGAMVEAALEPQRHDAGRPGRLPRRRLARVGALV
jgi:hypothetical protein